MDEQTSVRVAIRSIRNLDDFLNLLQSIARNHGWWLKVYRTNTHLTIMGPMGLVRGVRNSVELAGN